MQARIEQQAALEAVEGARTDMLRAAEARAKAQERSEVFESDRAQHAEMTAERREELSRVHESLRQASREVARVHQQLNRAHLAPRHSASFVNLGDKAVIGVILGDSTDIGVPVLGVSPDGPSERAGIQQGDVIISMMGETLSEGDEEDARAVLTQVMEGVKVGDELVIAVNRDGALLERIVVADKREPFAWQSIVRLPSVPSVPAVPGVATAPHAQVFIERIEIPDIDEKALHVQVEKMREDIDRTRVIINGKRFGIEGDAPTTYDYEFETFSEFGDEVLRETNVWFGLPVTRGLKLAEIDEGLGEYFKTDRGVLVLKARDDNDLQLQSGDVILDVGGKEVIKPSDVMRALRDWEPGATIQINIKRDRKDKTLDILLEDKMLGFDFTPLSDELQFQYHTEDSKH